MPNHRALEVSSLQPQALWQQGQEGCMKLKTTMAESKLLNPSESLPGLAWPHCPLLPTHPTALIPPGASLCPLGEASLELVLGQEPQFYVLTATSISGSNYYKFGNNFCSMFPLYTGLCICLDHCYVLTPNTGIL